MESFLTQALVECETNKTEYQFPNETHPVASYKQWFLLCVYFFAGVLQLAPLPDETNKDLRKRIHFLFHFNDSWNLDQIIRKITAVNCSTVIRH